MHLDNFSGPFDLLLSLIAKHQMDITEVALRHRHRRLHRPHPPGRGRRGTWTRPASSSWWPPPCSTSRPRGCCRPAQVEDAEDLALLEARDLLFARLLQYRAYKLVAGELATRFATSGRRVPRAVSLDPHLAGLLPELVFSLTPQQLAEIAARALAPRPGPPEVGLDHLHGSAVSVAEQAEVLVTRMRRSGVATFRDLVADAESTLVVVARFLALLELFRESAVTFEQASALGELTVRWTGTESGDRRGQRRVRRDGRGRAGVTSQTDDVQEPAVEEGLDLELLPGGARAALEGVLMVVDEPVSEVQLAAALVLPRERVRELLEALSAEYVEQQRGFELREIAGGWRLYSRPELAAVVQRFVLDGQTARLTQAALETLAVIAYRQPVSRARVSAVRGVNVDGVVRTLTTRGLVTEVGTDEHTGATLYGTTTTFLERMGLGSLDELPALAPYLPDADVLDELAEGHA